ncbi:hypothetical protein GCM10009799_01960 [Nocardiopsis rhodophaea]|uniref:Uncharacterized protein n=1 Tax=Nocardiopsis rhodophaea TaxID=280238 RepID=A0ABN2S4Y5_9ACTN
MTTATDARWGRTRAYADHHAQAARLQAAYPQFVIWYGEHTGAWFAMTPSGLTEATTLDALTLAVWSLTEFSADQGSQRPRVRTGIRRLLPRPRPRGGR